MARRVVLQGIGGAVAGGNPVMRPDQQLQPTSRAGTGPAPQNAFLVNPIIVVTPGRGVFIYSPHPGLGNLIGSIAATGGTDPYGNRYLPGTASYGVSGSGYVASQLNNGALFLQQNTTFGGAYTAAGEINIGGGPEMQFSPGTSIAYAFNPTVPLTAGQVILDPVATPTAATTGELEVHGTVGLKNAGTPATVAGYAQPLASGGNLVYVNGLAGDANLYDTGMLHLVTSPAFTVSATVFPNAVPGVTVNLGIGHYRFRCVINCTTAAGAGAPQFEFTFPSATGVMMQTYTPTSTAGNAQSNQNSFSAATSLSLAVGPTLNTHGFICVWEGDLTTTAAGSLALNAITNTLGDNYVVATAWLDLYPVN